MPVKLNHNRYGTGKPVLVLHGLFGSSRNWQTYAKKLAQQYSVITADLRNHGESGQSDSMRYEEMAEDILNLLDDLCLSQVTLAGHSMGGKVAMMVSLLQRERVEKLIVLDIAPATYDHRFGKIFHAMRNLPLNDIKNRQDAEILLDEKIQDIFLTRFLLQNLIRVEGQFQWRINLTGIHDNIDSISTFPVLEQSQKFPDSALFLGGENSHYILPEHYELIFGYFPNAEIDHIKDAGHMLHVEQPRIVLNRLEQFLQT